MIKVTAGDGTDDCISSIIKINVHTSLHNYFCGYRGAIPAQQDPNYIGRTLTYMVGNTQPRTQGLISEIRRCLVNASYKFIFSRFLRSKYKLT